MVGRAAGDLDTGGGIMDILKDIFSKITLHDTIKEVADKGLDKLTVSAIRATLMDLGTIFAMFIILIVMDILTRCMAMSALLWRNMYGEGIVKKRGNLMNYIRWIWQAHKWRYIDSSALRDGFWSKVITYFILLVVATCGDQILRVSHIPPFVLIIFCGILVCTEVLSILENLGECGVSSVRDIRSLIQKRKEGIK